jgi:hypothetical protein
VGRAPIRASAGTLASPDYVVTRLVDGTLTIAWAVDPATLGSTQTQGPGEYCNPGFGDALHLQIVDQGSRLPEGMGFSDVVSDLSIHHQAVDGLDLDDLPRSGNSFLWHRGAENCVRGG